jgi:hypothetical protein
MLGLAEKITVCFWALRCRFQRAVCDTFSLFGFGYQDNMLQNYLTCLSAVKKAAFATCKI